jgi:hypothetical protein
MDTVRAVQIRTSYCGEVSRSSQLPQTVVELGMSQCAVLPNDHG